MSKKHIRLDKLRFKETDWIKLHNLSTKFLSLAVHDIRGSLHTIRGCSQLIQEHFDELKSDDDKLSKLMSIIISESKSLSHTLETLVLFKSSYESNPFVSMPFEIVMQIKKGLNNDEQSIITLRKSCSKSIEIVYPENILSGILKELITNAIKYNNRENKTKKVLLKWEIQVNKFICEVHDNGPKITKELKRSFLPLDALPIREKASGLSIINRLISLSNGHLFFAESNHLGGTLIYFDFPILAYYRKGMIYECKK